MRVVRTGYAWNSRRESKQPDLGAGKPGRQSQGRASLKPAAGRTLLIRMLWRREGKARSAPSDRPDFDRDLRLCVDEGDSILRCGTCQGRDADHQMRWSALLATCYPARRNGFRRGFQDRPQGTGGNEFRVVRSGSGNEARIRVSRRPWSGSSRFQRPEEQFPTADIVSSFLVFSYTYWLCS